MSDKNNYALYYFASCPFCLKARFQLSRMGIELPLKNIKRDPSHKKTLIEGGGKKQVPCLRIENEKGLVEWLYESKDIIQFFKNQNFKNKSFENQVA